jgi:hypothetical protein
VRTSPTGGIGDQWIVALSAADKPCLGLGLTHVPTADGTEHPSADAYMPNCVRSQLLGTLQAHSRFHVRQQGMVAATEMPAEAILTSDEAL